jgi:tetratricopeptide (TPR) repeat protein
VILVWSVQRAPFLNYVQCRGDESGGGTMGRHFISYSRRDGEEFADWLYCVIWRITPQSPPWMDRRDLVAGFSYDDRLEQAISMSQALLFVGTRDASNSNECKNELKWADQHVKPIIPLRFHADAQLPMALVRRTSIDFTRESERPSRLLDLKRQLELIASPAGRADQNMERLQRWNRELLVAPEAERPAIQQKIAAIERENEELLPLLVPSLGAPQDNHGTAVADPQELAPARPSAWSVNWSPTKLLDKPEFQDREEELERLTRLLQDDDVRIISVTGSEGIGKTRMVRQLLEELRSDRATASAVDLIVPLTTHPASPLSAALVLEELRRRLPGDLLNSPEGPQDASDLSLRQMADALLARLAGTRVIIVIDSAEELLDEHTGLFHQADLDELLRFLAARRDHRVTVLLVSRVRPEPLRRDLPGRVQEVVIKTGLPREAARDLLRGLDPGDQYGLADINPTLLDRAYILTRGRPRALEALHGDLTLPDSPHASLEQVLDAAADIRPEESLDFLVGQLLKHLDLPAWNVALALAIYGQPVSRAAIEDLLRPFTRGNPIDSALDRLLSARLVWQDGERFYLPPPNDARVLKLIPTSGPARPDGESPLFVRQALLRRAAAYFASMQTDDVRSIEDLSPRLSQIRLLIRAEDYEEALELADEVDERYLDRWGYTQVLTQPREALRDNLDDDWDRLVNLSALGRINEQSNRLLAAADCYADALEIARALNRVDVRRSSTSTWPACRWRADGCTRHATITSWRWSWPESTERWQRGPRR